MSDIDLDEIEARANGAEPGPWAVNDEEEDNFCVTPTGRWEDGLTWAGKRADAEFIAHARTDVPALVAEVRRLTEVRDELRLEVSILQTTLRGALAAGEAYKATVDRVRALADEYAKDEREHLDRFGHHHPVAHDAERHLRDALDGKP